MGQTQLYVSGPASCWVGTGVAQAFEYLGYSETGFSVSLAGLYDDVETDFSGKMPADVSFQGESAAVSGSLKYYDEVIAAKMYSFFATNSTQVNKSPGAGGPNIVGSLMVAQGGTVPLLIYSPYQMVSQFGRMVPGFLFYTSYLSDPYNQTLNIKPKAPTIGFRAIPIYGSFMGSVFQPGVPPFTSYQMYTNAIPAALPGGVLPAYD